MSTAAANATGGRSRTALYLFVGGFAAITLVSAMATWLSSMAALPEERAAVLDRLASDRVMLDGDWYDFAPGCLFYMAVPEAEAAPEEEGYWDLPPLGRGYAWGKTDVAGLADTPWGTVVVARFATGGGGERRVTELYVP